MALSMRCTNHPSALYTVVASPYRWGNWGTGNHPCLSLATLPIVGARVSYNSGVWLVIDECPHSPGVCSSQPVWMLGVKLSRCSHAKAPQFQHNG